MLDKVLYLIAISLDLAVIWLIIKRIQTEKE